MFCPLYAHAHARTQHNPPTHTTSSCSAFFNLLSMSSAMGNRKPHFTISRPQLHHLPSLCFLSVSIVISSLFLNPLLCLRHVPAGPFVLSGSPEKHLRCQKGLISDNVLIAVIHLHRLSQLCFDHPADLQSLSSRCRHAAVHLQGSAPAEEATTVPGRAFAVRRCEQLWVFSLVNTTTCLPMGERDGAVSEATSCCLSAQHIPLHTSSCPPPHPRLPHTDSLLSKSLLVFMLSHFSQHCILLCLFKRYNNVMWRLVYIRKPHHVTEYKESSIKMSKNDFCYVLC